MDKFVIEGGTQLKGDVTVSGAKNAALPILAATILTPKQCKIANVPKLKDIDTMKNLLAGLGTEIEFHNDTILMKTSELESFEAPYELVKTMRASVLLLGPLVGRCGRARVSMPGGCAIGARPINLHIEGLKKLGASVELAGGYIEVNAQKLKGTRFHFDIQTVTGTMNIIMAAVFADGETILENCAMEPEVVELASFLKKMGARIEGEGTPEIRIKGVGSLEGGEQRIIPDRIETGTYIAAAAITGGEITINGANPSDLEAVINKFSEVGLKIGTEEKGKIRIRAEGRLKSVDISTSPYPGFPTDMQAQFMAAMTIADGSSVITENIFEGRFMHEAELRRLGADIRQKGASCIVKGVRELYGAPVMATDLRASASLVIAGLAAKGKTEVRRIYHLDRGYERMEKKLEGLGARVSRVKE